MIQRVLRVAKGFTQAEAMDRDDAASLSFEARISAVERLRRERFAMVRVGYVTLDDGRHVDVLKLSLAPRPKYVVPYVKTPRESR